MTERIQYFDFLKLYLIVMVVVDHNAVSLLPIELGHVHPLRPDDCVPSLFPFCAINSMYIMPLFFFISGYFVPNSLEKQGASKFIINKVIRLGVPLLVLVPIQSFYYGYYTVEHLWYIENLLFFCAVYVFVHHCFDKTCVYNQFLIMPLLFVISVVVAFAMFYIRLEKPFMDWYNLFGFISMEPAHYPQYVVMFVLGIYFSKSKGLNSFVDSYGIYCFIAGMILVLLFFLYQVDLIRYVNSRLYCFHEAFASICFSLGLIWLFSKFVFPRSRFLCMLCDLSYGLYIFHLYVIQFAFSYVDKFYIPIFVKFVIVCVLSIILPLVTTRILRKVDFFKKVL